MKIKGIQSESFIDYPKGLSTVLFVGTCPYRCGSCHAKGLLESDQEYTEQEIISFLESRKKSINKVVITGGEPTKEKGLISFIEELGKRNFDIKLDTNGSAYEILLEIKDKKLVNYIAMDVKGPLHLYPQLVGVKKINVAGLVESPIKIVSQFPDYEFRTTIVPILDNSQIRWLSPEEIKQTAELIQASTGSKYHKYFLQRFVAPKKNEVINPIFSKDHLLEEFHKTPKKYLEECLFEAQKILPNTRIR